MIKKTHSVAYTPQEFRPHHPFPYPPGNDMIFEEWYYANYNTKEDITDRTYLPIFWTPFYVSHHFGKDPLWMNTLEIYLSGMDTSKKYYTVVQYDDGIKADISHLDIKVFGMSGVGSDYPLPLLCKPHKFEYRTKEKGIFCSFLGKNTHPIRKRMIDLLKDNGRYLISETQYDIAEYCRIMSRSLFALCPRGYGINSFRIQEALQYGAIPVYVSDQFVLPHHIPFEEYGVVIPESEIDNIDSILLSIPESEIIRKRQRIPNIFAEYFTYEANKNLILKNLRDEVA